MISGEGGAFAGLFSSFYAPILTKTDHKLVKGHTTRATLIAKTLEFNFVVRSPRSRICENERIIHVTIGKVNSSLDL